MSNILIETQGAVTTITINRPEKKNALTREMYQTMADALDEANQTESCKVVVIRAEGDVPVTKSPGLRIMALNPTWQKPSAL